MYWDPARATCIVGNRNERLMSVDNNFRNKMRHNISGYKDKDIVTVDTKSLAELSKIATANAELNHLKKKLISKYKRMQHNFDKIQPNLGIIRQDLSASKDDEKLL